MTVTLEAFLGPWIYWPLVAAFIGFAVVSLLSNVSMIYTELRDQLRELRRLRK